MVKVGKWIARHRVLMLIVGFLLIIPSVIGMAKTREHQCYCKQYNK